MRWDVCSKCLFGILHLCIWSWLGDHIFSREACKNEWRGMIDSLTRQKAMCLPIWRPSGASAHSFLKTNSAGIHGATRSNEETYQTKISNDIYIYVLFEVPWKECKCPIGNEEFALNTSQPFELFGPTEWESYWAMQVARVGLEACKGTRKAYRQHVVEIPVKISIYIYAVYCFCIQHSGQYVYSICLVYFQFANSRNLNDWGMNMEVGNSAFATVSHGCHFQTQMARKTLGSFCQLFSSDFGSDCCGNGSAESQVDKNKSSYKHSRADLIFQRNLRDPEGKLSLESVFVILCMFVPEGNAVTTIRILHDLVRVVAVEFCKCLMLDVGVIRRFMACPQARSREIPSIFPLALHWNSCISLLHEHAIDMRLIIVYLQI